MRCRCGVAQSRTQLTRLSSSSSCCNMERKLKTATGEPIKHFREIQRLLAAICCPKGVTAMHYKGHSKDASKEAKVISWLTVKPEKWLGTL